MYKIIYPKWMRFNQKIIIGSHFQKSYLHFNNIIYCFEDDSKITFIPSFLHSFIPSSLHSFFPYSLLPLPPKNPFPPHFIFSIFCISISIPIAVSITIAIFSKSFSFNTVKNNSRVLKAFGS
jgi:hypothetical protein